MNEHLRSVGVVQNPLDLIEFVFDPTRDEEEKRKERESIIKWVLVIFAMLIGGFLVISLYLRRAVHRRTAELRASEGRYRTLLELAPYGISRSDASGIITYSNPAHARMHGYEPEELVGKEISTFIRSEPEREEFQDYYAALMKDQPPPARYTGVNRTRDGRDIDVEVDWTYDRDQDGRPTGIVSIVTDVTERNRLERQVRQTQKFEAIGRLAGGVAHEFNNLLMVVLGNLEFLKSGVESNQELYSIAERTENRALRGAQLTNNTASA
jgi:PAS domain S-box-containing protein